MPVKVIHCSHCGTAITGYDFPARMAKLRRHYKRKHPVLWKKSIRRGVRARAKGR